MKVKNNFTPGVLSGIAIFIIILDIKCATQSATEGIDLCLRTVIPSLFPFFVLSTILNSCLLGKTIRFLRPLGKLCSIPAGGESLLLLGYITGYPVGAQLITQGYRKKSLSAATAHRLLGFCNNAGPAFIFGMLSPIFTAQYAPWLLWGIHIVSGIIVGFMIPVEDNCTFSIKEPNPASTSYALQNALCNIATVCGWVVLFRILLGYANKWFLWRLSPTAHVILAGILELANGCIALNTLPSAGLKFIIASGILALGGLCVGMQTRSVTQDLGTGYYFPGKILQCLFSILISILIQKHIFVGPDICYVHSSVIFLLIFSAIVIIFILRRKKL